MTKWLSAFLTLAVLLVLAYVITDRVLEIQDKRVEEAKGQVLRPPKVRVSQEGTHDFVKSIKVTAQILPKRSVYIVPKLGGRIEALMVALGDEVKEGQVLAEIEENDLELRQAQGAAGKKAALAQRNQAKVQVDLLQKEVARASALYKDGVLPEAELTRLQGQLQAAKMGLGAATAQVDLAGSGLGLAELAIEWTRLSSPISGVVTRVFLDEGAMAGPESPLFEIQDQSVLRIRASIPASALPAAKEAMRQKTPVNFQVESLGERGFQGEVKAIGKALAQETRRLPIEIEAPGSLVEEGVLPYMMARIQMVTERFPKARAVPIQALVNRPGGAIVFALTEDERVKAYPVTLKDESHLMLPDGVPPGSRIVMEGQHSLQDGDKVTVLENEGKAP